MKQVFAADRVLAVIAALTLTAATAPAQESSSTYPLAAFFPPTPPAYGATIPEQPVHYSVLSGRPMKPPDDMAEWVGEYFYPPLATRTFDGAIAKKLRDRLQVYRAARTELLNELTDELDRLQYVDRVARERDLRALAPKQAARIAAMEQQAEQLRTDLVRGRLLGSSVEWNQVRNWQLGDNEIAKEPWQSEAEFQVMRAAAHYQDGFRVEQRGLLRELAIELAAKARAARVRKPTPDADSGAFFFSPEMARMHLGGKLPAELVSKLGRFNHDKLALKLELFNAVAEMDKSSDKKRTLRAAALAEAQAPLLAALEQLADEIRSELANLAVAPPPWLPPIPAPLAQRIELYSENRSALTNELEITLERARVQILRPWEIGFDFPAKKREQEMERRIQRAQADRAKVSAEFERQNRDRITTLRALYESIVTEAEGIAQNLRDPQSGRQMTALSLLAAHHTSMRIFDLMGREEVMYARYASAMLQPGLSPGQRRLLFVAAQISLSQALPAGEDITRPQDRPRPQSLQSQ